MANLHKFTVQEALNASQGSAGNWDNKTEQTINATGGTTIHITLSSSTHIVMMQPTVDVQFSFTTAEADIDADDDLHISADAITSIAVPRGLGGTVVLNFISNSSSTGTMKVVEV